MCSNLKQKEDFEKNQRMISERFRAGDLDGVRELLDPDKFGGESGLDKVVQLLDDFLKIKPKDDNVNK